MPRDDSPLPKNDVFDLLSRLVDKSLVSVESQSERLARFRMLETTRAYALERLQASTDWDEVCRAHAAFFVELAERADQHIRGAQQKQWLETLEGEYDNIRAALRWLFDTMDVTRGARLASALWWFWTIRGYLSEGLAWYERAMRLCTRRDALRAQVLLGAGLILYSQSNFSRARSLLEESAAIWREGNTARDRHGLAFALMLLGHVLTWQGD